LPPLTATARHGYWLSVALLFGCRLLLLLVAVACRCYCYSFNGITNTYLGAVQPARHTTLSWS
jgi:hypothetical protein